MMSARGCSFKCTFCYRMDPGYRKRDPKALLDEVEMVHKDDVEGCIKLIYETLLKIKSGEDFKYL